MINLEPVKKWFGFNRRERRGSFILVIIITLLLLVRIITPVTNSKIEDITPEISALVYPVKADDAASSDSGTGFIRATAYKKVYNSGKKNARNFAGTAGSDQQNGKEQFRRRQPMDINTCDSAMLESLPGIGPVLAVRIIKYRNLLGGYASVKQLREVYGLPPETFEMIKERLFADSLKIRKVDINSAGYRELSRFPYLENFDVTAILKFRQIQKKINNLDELVENKIVAPEKAEMIRPYMVFE